MEIENILIAAPVQNLLMHSEPLLPPLSPSKDNCQRHTSAGQKRVLPDTVNKEGRKIAGRSSGIRKALTIEVFVVLVMSIVNVAENCNLK